MKTYDKIKLPPLPDPTYRGPSGTGNYFDGYTKQTLQAYATAAIEADRQQREQEYPHEQMDAIGATRFKVVPCPENVGLVFSTHAVKAGDGEQTP